MLPALVLDPERRHARCGDAEVSLAGAPVLFGLLEAIAQGAERRGPLFERVWQQNYRPPTSDNTLRVNVTRLRHALARFPFRVAVTPLGGYALEPAPPVDVRAPGQEGLARLRAAAGSDPLAIALFDEVEGDPDGVAEVLRLLPLFGASALLDAARDPAGGPLGPVLARLGAARWNALSPADGDLDATVAWSEAALPRLEAAGDRHAAGVARANLGVALRRVGRHAEAPPSSATRRSNWRPRRRWSWRGGCGWSWPPRAWPRATCAGPGTRWTTRSARHRRARLRFTRRGSCWAPRRRPSPSARRWYA